MTSNVLISRLIKYLLIWVRSFTLRNPFLFFVFSRPQLLLFSGPDCTLSWSVSTAICARFEIALWYFIELCS